MNLFLKSFFYSLVALSLSACSSGLVYAPVSDLTQPPAEQAKPVKVLPKAPVKTVVTSKDWSLGQLSVERIESEKVPSPAKKIPSHLVGEGAPKGGAHPLLYGHFSASAPVSQKSPAYAPAWVPDTVHPAPPQGGGRGSKPETNTPTSTPAEPEESPEVTAPVVSKGGWSWPTKGKVVSRFVASSISGNKGVDIQGALGQPIWATAGGKVVYSGSGVRGYGNLIIIKHNQNYLSAYAYNQRLLVKEGDSVKGGQVIAEMGKAETGRVLLHFEIRYNGQPVDPLVYLK